MRRVLLATTALTVAVWAGPAAAMPPILLGAAGAAAATGVSGAIAGTATALVLKGVLASALLGGITAAAGQLLAPRPNVPDAVLKQQVPTQDPTVARRIIYGRARVAPEVLYSAVTNDKTQLHLVHVLAGHECDGLEAIYFDDEEVWTAAGGWGSYKGHQLQTVKRDYAAMTFHSGAEDQEADAQLVDEVAEWTAAHRGQGVAWVYLRLYGELDVFPRGIPVVNYLVRGRKVHDPRTGTTAWSANPALVINDWILNNRYGYRERPKFWSEDAVIAAANVSEEQVALAAGGTEDRYSFGGAFRADADKEDVLRQMLTSCFGMVPREGPRRRLLVGAWRPPVVELTDEDLAGSVDITVGKSKADTFEAVRGRFHSPDADFLPDEYPEVVSDGHDPATGDPKYFQLDLPFTPSGATAQRIAKLTLLSQAQRIVGTASWKIKALRLRAGDTFMWTSARRGWSQKVFEVTDRSLSVEGEPPAMRVTLTCRETSAAVHDWTVSDEQPYIAGVPTLLPDPYDVTPPSLAIRDEIRIAAQQLMTVLIVQPSSSSVNAARFEVQARRVGTVEAINLGHGPSGDYELPFVEDGKDYEARGRTITHTGSASDWTAWQSHTVIGKSARPADVTGFRMEIIEGNAHLSWEPVADLDLSHYQVRHSPLITGATFDAAIDVAAKVARPATSTSVPWQSGTYLIVAVDKSGNRSATPALIVTTITGLPGFNAVETVNESAPFDGTHDQTREEDNALRLDKVAAAPFVGDIADIGAVTDMGEVGVAGRQPEGWYTLPGAVDLGAVYTSRVSASASVTRFEPGTGMDGVDDMAAVDDFDGIGGASQSGDTNVEVQISTTEDDPAGAPTWSAWVTLRAGDYRARGLRFRLHLTTLSTDATPSLTSAAITIDMPDRVVSGQDIASGAAAKAITFLPAFFALKGVAITAQNMLSGDHWEISAKSETGFTITFRDSGGAAVDRLFDYQAIGYGEAA